MSDCHDNFECLFNVVLCEFVGFKRKVNREVYDSLYVTIIIAGLHVPQIAHASEPRWYASLHPHNDLIWVFWSRCVVCAAQFCHLFISLASLLKSCCANRRAATLTADDVAHLG